MQVPNAQPAASRAVLEKRPDGVVTLAMTRTFDTIDDYWTLKYGIEAYGHLLPRICKVPLHTLGDAIAGAYEAGNPAVKAVLHVIRAYGGVAA